VSAAEFGFPLAGERVTVVRGAQGIVIEDRDGTPIGTVELEHAGEGEVFIKSVCIEESKRGYGAGTEATRLLLEAAAEAGTVVRAWAPPDLGLAVYFWIRMGLRPLHSAGPNGGILFEWNPDR